MTTNLVQTLNSPQYVQMKEALQKGPQEFLNWYNKNTDKKTFNTFRAKNKDWSKYFRINK